MTLFSKSYISYGVKVLCVIKWCCVFSQEQIGRGHVYIEHTEKVLTVLLLSTPKKYCAGKMRIRYFSGQVFFVWCANKNGHCVW